MEQAITSTREAATDGRPFSRASMLAALDAIMRHARHVRLNRHRLEDVARLIPVSIASSWIDTFRDSDEHYQHNLPPLPIELTDLDLLQWSVVSGSQGWLIWQREPAGTVVPFTIHIDGVKYVGGTGLEVCHARAIRRGTNILDPQVLMNYTLRDVEDHYRDELTQRVTLPLPDKRLAKFRAVGHALTKYRGHFVNVLERAGGHLFRDDGTGLIQLLQTDFGEVFDDWPFAKRPYVLANSLVERRKRKRFPARIDELLAFKDLEDLEGGADYYRPLWFIRVGILDVSDELKHKLAERELLEPGSQMESEFRAFTVHVVRELAKRVGTWPDSLGAIALETHGHPFLRCRRCRVGIPDSELPCPYRPICKATHEDLELMQCGWPLTLTTDY
jgi:Potential Queuosine, Q, salvage protein family